MLQVHSDTTGAAHHGLFSSCSIWILVNVVNLKDSIFSALVLWVIRQYNDVCVQSFTFSWCKEDLQGHVKLDHLKTLRLAPEVEHLPWIAQVFPNKSLAPGEVTALAPWSCVPEGSVCYSEKPRVTALMPHSSVTTLWNPPTIAPIQMEIQRSCGSSSINVSPGTRSSLANQSVLTRG